MRIAGAAASNVSAADVFDVLLMTCCTRLDLLAAVGEDAEASPFKPSAVVRLPAQQHLPSDCRAS